MESCNDNLCNNASDAILNVFLMNSIKYRRVPQFSKFVYSVQQCMLFGAKKQLCVPLLCLTLKVEYKSLAKMIHFIYFMKRLLYV